MEENKYTYDAKLVRVIDGDTVVLFLQKEYVYIEDFGFGIKDEIKFVKKSTQTFRLFGIDTPEIVGADKVNGLKAQEALYKLLDGAQIKVISHGKDSFGRWLGTVIINSNGLEINVNQWLLEQNYAKPYVR